MNTITQTTAYFRARPILIGVLTVLVTTGIGASIAISTGFVDPSSVFASGNPTCTLAVDEVDESALDYDDDGQLTSADAEELLKIAVDLQACPAGKICDVNGDGNVLASDAQMVLVYVTNKLPTSGAYTLSWTSNGATGMSIDNGIGAVIPIVLGHVGVSPTVTTTYTATATGPSGTGHCSATITVELPAPSCTLTADRHDVTVGEQVTFSWTTQNAVGFAMNHNIGQLTPVSSGSKTVTITDRDTYFGTAQRDGIGSSCFDANLVVRWPDTAKPDLTASAVSPKSTNAIGGVAETFYATISNIGGAATGAPFYTLVQRTNAIDANGNATGAVQMVNVLGTSPLAAGASTVKSVEYTFPTTENGTTRYLRFCADKTQYGPADGDIDESNETNNCGPWTAITVGTVQQPAPTCTLKAIPPSSLTLSAIDYNDDSVLNDADAQYLLEVAVGSKTCPSGKICDVNGDGIVRGGTDPYASDALSVLRYVNNPNRLGELTLQWGTTNATDFSLNQGIGSALDTIAIGTTGLAKPTVTTTYTGTATGPGGSDTCSVTVTIDAPTQKPDLTASVVSPTTATAGVAKTFSATISNIGGASTNAPFYTLVQRTNAIDAEGNATGAVQMVDVLGTTPLAAGASTVKSVEYTFPTSENGTTRYLRFCADKTQYGPADGDIDESNETNNCGPWTAIRVGTPPVATCTYTQGYWKTHNASFSGGAPADPTWAEVGALKEGTSFAVSGNTWFGVFWTQPSGNVYYTLAHQYMAAKLNVLRGASMPGNVTTAFNTATSLLSNTAPNGNKSEAQWTQLAGVLGSYNEGNQGVPHCSEPQPPQPVAPTCTLTIDPNSITAGGSATLGWSTTGGVSFSINQNIGAVSTIPGSRSVSPSETTTYTGTVTGPGGTAHCNVTLAVTPTDNPAPTCALTATPGDIVSGENSTLAWSTTRATSFSINQGIGAVATTSGSRTVSPTATTTYTGTVTGPDGTVNCTTTIDVAPLPPPPAPTCTLAATPSRVDSGGRSVLSWTTSHGASFAINQGVGAVSPVAVGTTSTAALTQDTTFTGTVTSASGQTATCSTQVTINTGGGGGGNNPTCSLSVSPSSYREGSDDAATLSWNGSNVTSVDIDHGIATNASVPGSVRVNPSGEGTYTYRGVFRATNGTTVNCSATLEVTRRSSGGSSRSSSGSRPNPSVLVSSVAHAGQVAGEYVYLSQMPYTGLDLGPVGTVLYWILLIGWSGLLAYIVLFNGVPALRRQFADFGGQVQMILNTPSGGGAATMPFQSMPVAPVMRQTALAQDETRGYSAYEGFKSFAKNETLSIEDIVKGLARSHKIPSAASQSAAMPAMPAHTEPIYENVEPIEAAPAQSITEHVAEASGISTDVRGFTYAILEGDREGTFAGLRQYARGGGKPETLISQAAFLIDDAYRARVEGAECDTDIARHAARLSTPQLEKLVTSLTTAIDSSYSTGIAGAKLALTRALAVLGA